MCLQENNWSRAAFISISWTFFERKSSWARQQRGSLCQLRSLEHQNLTCEYAEVIEDQKKVDVVERAKEMCVGGREFYIPHKPVMQASAESTKLWVAIAFDGFYHSTLIYTHERHCRTNLERTTKRKIHVLQPLTGICRRRFLVRERDSNLDAIQFRNEHSTYRLWDLPGPSSILPLLPFCYGYWEEKEPEIGRRFAKSFISTTQLWDWAL